MADPKANTGSGAVLQLLASGLRFWIRQQCEVVEGLELQLHGSGLGLLRGRIEAVSLVAQRVVFNNLELEDVELRSTSIEVQVGGLFKGQPVRLEQPFWIEGNVAFSEAGLRRSLGNAQWHALGDQIADGLLGLSPLQTIGIDQDHLVLSADHRRCAAIPRIVQGALQFCSCTGQPCVSLPGDPNITLENAQIANGQLQISGKARVSP